MSNSKPREYFLGKLVHGFNSYGHKVGTEQTVHWTGKACICATNLLSDQSRFENFESPTIQQRHDYNIIKATGSKLKSKSTEPLSFIPHPSSSSP